MKYSDAINKIMPEVENGGAEPFIIFRDPAGNWDATYTRNRYGVPCDWVDDVKKQDPFASIFTGKDFAHGSFASVCDTVLFRRINSEYHKFRDDLSREFDDSPSGLRRKKELDKEPYALVSFFEDNVSAFSHKTTDYLAALERPFAALREMCPFSLATNHGDWRYNHDLAADAADKIETAVEQRLDIEAEMGYEIEQPKPEPAIEPEKPMNYALIKHGQRDEIDFGMFATVAEAKQYAAECGITNYTIKKLNKESLLASLDKNKAKVAQNKAASPAPPKKPKQKEVGD